MIRVDLFLKLSRLVKRRTIAQEMADIGAVSVNERAAKPSTPVRKGDVVDIAYTARVVRICVNEDEEARLRRPGLVPFDVLEERKVDPATRPW